eukprot:7999747-Pyramimonas_sp.AAC.1
MSKWIDKQLRGKEDDLKIGRKDAIYNIPLLPSSSCPPLSILMLLSLTLLLVLSPPTLIPCPPTPTSHPGPIAAPCPVHLRRPSRRSWQ